MANWNIPQWINVHLKVSTLNKFSKNKTTQCGCMRSSIEEGQLFSNYMY